MSSPPVSADSFAARALSALRNGPWLRWQLRRDIYTPLEAALLDVLAASVDPATADVVRSQRREINYVQRVTARTSESDFYRYLNYRISLERSLKFPFLADEVCLATCRFRVAELNPVQVEYFVVRGNLFSLDFDADVRRMLTAAGVEVLSFKQNVAAAV